MVGSAKIVIRNYGNRKKQIDKIFHRDPIFFVCT